MKQIGSITSTYQDTAIISLSFCDLHVHVQREREKQSRQQIQTQIWLQICCKNIQSDIAILTHIYFRLHNACVALLSNERMPIYLLLLLMGEWLIKYKIRIYSPPSFMQISNILLSVSRGPHIPTHEYTQGSTREAHKHIHLIHDMCN